MYREICVHALSSPYCLLPRAHTYTLAVVLILPLPQGWLFRAALAAFTTRTAVFAIDAAVQLSALRRGDVHAFPLDVLAALEMLGLASAVATFLLLVSRRGRESSARGLLRGWALAVGVGCVLAFVGVTELGRLATVAYPQTGHETCDGVSIDFDDVFGLPAVAVRVLGMMTSKTAWFAQRVGIASLLFAALAIVSAAAASSESPRNYDLDPKKDIWESDDTRGESSSGLSTLLSLFSLLITLAVPAVSIFIVVSAEMYFNAMVGELPSAEKMTSVGQWGVWAATGAVVVATAVNAFKEKMRSSNPKVVHEPYKSAV